MYEGVGGSECVLLLGRANLWSDPLQPLEVCRVRGGDRKPGMAEALAGSSYSVSGTAALGPGASEAGKRKLSCLQVIDLRAESRKEGFALVCWEVVTRNCVPWSS